MRRNAQCQFPDGHAVQPFDSCCAHLCVGDDLNDLPVLTQVGLACAPADAVEEVKQVCHFVAEKKGGCGAVRQITEFILNARGDWDKIVNSYLQEGQGDAQ